MFCTNCGFKNEEGAAFCVSCGNAIQGAAAPQMPSAQPAQAQPAYSPYAPPKKRRKGLIIGLTIGGVILLAGIVVLVLWLTGVIGGGDSIVGEWENDGGRAFEFYQDGTVRAETPTNDFGGTYTYSGGKGTIIIEGQSGDFTVNGGVMDIEGLGDFYKVNMPGKDADMDGMDGFDMQDGQQGSQGQQGQQGNQGQQAQPQKGILGLWYEETGYAGTLEFYPDGTYEMDAMGMTFSGTYTFDPGSGSGELMLEFMGEESTSDFEISGGKLEVDGSVYQREPVEQKDMEELLEELDDIMGDVDFSEME